MNLAGVDEAGRGPVLGPLVIAGVVLHPAELAKLVNNGLTDSKLIPQTKREELYELILDLLVDYKVVIIEPSEIDGNRWNLTNLNKLEMTIMIDILSSLKDWSTAYVDACDVNAERCQSMFRNQLQVPNIIAEHSADINYPVVSAASVIAKVVRDREIEKAHKTFGIDFGSGYPNDPKTIRFLTDYVNQYGELPSIARKSWETSKRLMEFYQQSSLDEFFSDGIE